MGAKKFEKTFVLRNAHGLHARPATTFVQEALKFSSKISVLANGTLVDGKSVISILTLCLHKGAELTVRAEGKDAEAAMDSITKMMETSESFSQTA